MENSDDPCDGEVDGDFNEKMDNLLSTSSSYKLFGRQNPIMGAGQVQAKILLEEILRTYKTTFAGNPTIGDMLIASADVILWRSGHFSCGIIAVATVAWFLFERSGLSFLSISSDVLLILVVLQFLQANYLRDRCDHIRRLQPLPKLVLSEEMVNNAAAFFRVKFNYMLLMAHDITLGKDFKLFFKVVIALWLLSVISSLTSFCTLAYIGTIIFITIPALYSKIVDDNVINRLPRNSPSDKDL